MRKWLLLSIGLALGFLLWFAIGQVTEQTTLTAQQAETRVATLYDATVEHSIKKGEQYFVTFKKNTSTYEVTVDETDGGFSQLSLLMQEEQTEEPEPTPPPEPEQPEPTITLTEQQAIALAVASFPGTVEEIDFEPSVNGGHYLIEIETVEETEVTVQIHAITGKVLSFTFDD